MINKLIVVFAVLIWVAATSFSVSNYLEDRNSINLAEAIFYVASIFFVLKIFVRMWNGKKW
jgi:hypothetical protein